MAHGAGIRRQVAGSCLPQVWALLEHFAMAGALSFADNGSFWTCFMVPAAKCLDPCPELRALQRRTVRLCVAHGALEAMQLGQVNDGAGDVGGLSSRESED